MTTAELVEVDRYSAPATVEPALSSFQLLETGATAAGQSPSRPIAALGAMLLAKAAVTDEWQCCRNITLQ